MEQSERFERFKRTWQEWDLLTDVEKGVVDEKWCYLTRPYSGVSERDLFTWCERRSFHEFVTLSTSRSFDLESIERRVSDTYKAKLLERYWPFVIAHPVWSKMKEELQLSVRTGLLYKIDNHRMLPDISERTTGLTPHDYFYGLVGSSVLIDIDNTWNTPDTPALYVQGNIVKLKSTHKLAMINGCQGYEKKWRYTIHRKGVRSEATVMEEEIIEKMFDRPSSPAYQAGLFVQIDGMIYNIRNVLREFYPCLYDLRRRIRGSDDTDSQEYLDYDPVFIPGGDVIVCDQCDRYHLKSTTTTCNGDNYCPDCAVQCLSTCTECHRVFRGHNAMCNECYHRLYARCEDCGMDYRTVDMIEERGLHFCNRDHADHYLARHVFINYSTKVVPTFYHHDGESDKVGYGIELEVDVPKSEDRKDTKYNGAVAALQKIPQIYLKHDGSLRFGIEIITHPASVAYHEKTMPWDQIIRIVDRYGFCSHHSGTCGLHIHASRGLFGTTKDEQAITIGKVITFVDYHWRHVVRFSRRKEDNLNWCKKMDCDFTEPYALCVQNWMDQNHDHENRYVAVNTTYDPTVEFRIFRGTTNKYTIFACIEFVDFLIKRVSDYTFDQLKKVSWEEFFCTAPSLLNRYMAKKTLITKVGN